MINFNLANKYTTLSNLTDTKLLDGLGFWRFGKKTAAWWPDRGTAMHFDP